MSSFCGEQGPVGSVIPPGEAAEQAAGGGLRPGEGGGGDTPHRAPPARTREGRWLHPRGPFALAPSASLRSPPSAPGLLLSRALRRCFPGRAGPSVSPAHAGPSRGFPPGLAVGRAAAAEHAGGLRCRELVLKPPFFFYGLQLVYSGRRGVDQVFAFSFKLGVLVGNGWAPTSKQRLVHPSPVGAGNSGSAAGAHVKPPGAGKGGNSSF